MNHTADLLKQPTVNLGVTGHQFLEDLPTLTKAFEASLQMVEERYPNRKILLYSALAAGADHLAAETALKNNLPLVAIMPRDLESYLQGMSATYRDVFQKVRHQAVREVTVKKESGRSLFQEIETYLVENMDCLIAFWNGKEARGPGGTGEVVRKFDITRKPWVWIRTHNMVADNPQRLEGGLMAGSIQTNHW